MGKGKGGGGMFVDYASRTGEPREQSWIDDLGKARKSTGRNRKRGGGGLERRTRLLWEGWTLELDLVDGKREDHSGESVWRLWQ
jgi:hypothetical protein